MIVTRLAIGFGVAVFGGICWAAIAGSRQAAEIVITVGALVVLVGGGNWLGGRRSRPMPTSNPGGGPPGEGPASRRVGGTEEPGNGR